MSVRRRSGILPTLKQLSQCLRHDEASRTPYFTGPPVGSLSSFNCVHANNYKKRKTDRSISCGLHYMNSSASYLVDYGMKNLKVFAEPPGFFGDLQFYLDRDMGMVLPYPISEVVANFRDGEIIDDSPPRHTLKRKRLEYDMGCCGFEEPDLWPFLNHEFHTKLLYALTYPLIWPDKPTNDLSSSKNGLANGKGKEKLYQEYAFYDNGTLSMDAVKFLDEGFRSIRFLSILVMRW